MNKSSTYKPRTKNFIFPMLDVDLIHVSKEHNYLIGVYPIKDKSQIVMVFDNIDFEPLKMDIYKLQNNPYYLDSKYDDDDKEVCLLFNIPKEYVEDFERYLQGKYSQFSLCENYNLVEPHDS